MSQFLSGLGLKGGGIVAVLIIAGIFLAYFGVNPEASKTAINAGVTIGVILGILGIFGVVVSLAKRVSY